MKQKNVREMSHPSWLLTAVFIICAGISIFSAWARLNADAVLAMMEEQIRAAVEPAVLVLAVVFGLVALAALFSLLGLSFQKSCLILGVLSLAAVIVGAVNAYGSSTEVRSSLYRPEYLGGENRFGTVWYGILPGVLAVLFFGLAFQREISGLCLAETIYCAIVALCGIVFTVHSGDYKNAWNAFLPLTAAIGCFLGYRHASFDKIRIVLEILFGLWSLSGLWFVLQSGGRENVSFVVLPLAAALGIDLIGRELNDRS